MVFVKHPAATAAATVTVLALAAVIVLARPFAGQQDDAPARALAVNDTLYGLSLSGGEVLRMAPDGRVIARAKPAERPAKLVLVSGTHGTGSERAIVVSAASHRLTSFDAQSLSDATERALSIEPNLLAPSPDGEHIAIGDTGRGSVVMLNAASLKVVARADGLKGVHDLRFSESGKQLYVSTLGKARLVAFDAPGLDLKEEVQLSGMPYGIDHTVRTPDGRLGLVVSPIVPRVVPVMLASALQPLAPVRLPSAPSRAFVAPLGDAVWLPSAGDAVLQRLDLAAIAPGPTDKAAASRETVVLASLASADRTVPQPVDPAIATIELGSMPRTLSFEPFASTLLVATLDGLARVTVDGHLVEEVSMAHNPVIKILPIEGAAVSMLVHADGAVSRQHAHSELSPIQVDVPPIFGATTGSALAFCHG